MAAPILGSIGAQVDLLIKQGSDYGPHEFQLFAQLPSGAAGDPINLAGCSFAAQLRKKALDPDPEVAEFVCTITDAALGKFTIFLPDTITRTIPCDENLRKAASQYVWDCELTDSLGYIRPLYYGNVSVFREVTR